MHCRQNFNFMVLTNNTMMNRIGSIIFLSFLLLVNLYCSNDKLPVNSNDTIKTEIAIIDSLLHDENFALKMAETAEAAYYKALGETAPLFLSKGDDTAIITKSAKGQKIATSIAPFYALECGLVYLCANNDRTPTYWLQKILNNEAGDSAVLILNRFANAAWKAGQPFRDLTRIKRYNFIPASLLTEDEVKKDYNQVQAAAAKLAASLKTGSKEEEMQQLRMLLQDTGYALEISAFIDSMYYVSQKQAVAPFITPEILSDTVQKNKAAEKIAINIAGFYATECATNYLVTIQQVAPSVLLQSLVDGTMAEEDQLLYARFANVTWKAGQPFRSLNRISRETFTPFYYLNKADIDKDLVQVKAAAAALLKVLKPG